MLKIKKVLILLIAIITVIAMSGCGPDLGMFESDDDYIDNFGNVVIFNKSFGATNLDFGDDFYYPEDNMGEEFRAGMDLDEYSYIIFEIENKCMMTEVYLYISSDSIGSLTVDLLKGGGLPSGIRGYDDPDTPPSEDEEEEEEEEKEWSAEPEALASTGVGLKPGGWYSFGFNNKLIFEEGEYLIFRFVNNTYRGKMEGLAPLKFQVTGLFMRCLEIEEG